MADIDRNTRRGKHPKPLIDRFMASVAPVTESGCWIWTGAVCRGGYGKMGAGMRTGKTVKTHRVAWELFRGPIPDGDNVLHRCDVPSCVNPNHLWIGSHADNVADKILKGRSRNGVLRGEMNPQSKLTHEQANAIRADTRNQDQIAADYGISRSNVSSIKRGITWNW